MLIGYRQLRETANDAKDGEAKYTFEKFRQKRRTSHRLPAALREITR